jgi:hypothetical protein
LLAKIRDGTAQAVKLPGAQTSSHWGPRMHNGFAYLDVRKSISCWASVNMVDNFGWFECC